MNVFAKDARAGYRSCAAVASSSKCERRERCKASFPSRVLLSGNEMSRMQAKSLPRVVQSRHAPVHELIIVERARHNA